MFVFAYYYNYNNYLRKRTENVIFIFYKKKYIK